MDTTQYAMVEELASLIKDNLPCKHLILSIEEELVNFIQGDTRLNGVLELQPMNPYYRMFVHRLADIFGFSHQSVGEGEDRHIILERCEETLIPSILVSDLLWQYDEVQPHETFDVLRREKAIEGMHTSEPSQKLVVETSLEDRETAYLAARERIFSTGLCEMKVVKQRPRPDPQVAKRMITHALGGRNSNNLMNDNEIKQQNRNSSEFPTPKVHNKLRGFESSGSKVPLEKIKKTLTEVEEKHLKEEQRGAAKRLFANALGIRK